MKVPEKFCWTKMGSESGESLQSIVIRKDYERQIGDGLFMWGIGNALGEKIWNLVESVSVPMVYFSTMKAKPKPADTSPDSILLWTSYIDRFNNIKPLPSHVFITSRGTTRFNSKVKHYALVCKSKSHLNLSNGSYLDLSCLKNINSHKNKLGFSQVTAVVEKHGEQSSIPKMYPLIFRAELVYPYYVTLIEPVMIPVGVVSEINSLICSRDISIDVWKDMVRDLKGRYVSSKPFYRNTLFS